MIATRSGNVPMYPCRRNHHSRRRLCRECSPHATYLISQFAMTTSGSSMTAEVTVCTQNELTTKNASVTDSQTCQICLDEFEAKSLVTKLCSAACPAVVCEKCLVKHLHIAIHSAFFGVLPKVRCPICLVLMNKIHWRTYVSNCDFSRYVTLCERACSFRTPCCHNDEYTHLPQHVGCSVEWEKKFEELGLDQAKLPELHQLINRFNDHNLSASEIVRFMVNEFGDKTSLTVQDQLAELVYSKFEDEERRATLLLAYHAKYKCIKTRCCNAFVCFNCKRKLRGHDSHKVCESGVLEASSIVECRWCHVTMVKSEGCDVVRCWCGVLFSWGEELQLYQKNQRGLVPVDLFDHDLYKAWNTWRRKLVAILTGHLVPHCRKKRREQLNRLLLERKKILRPAVQVLLLCRRWRRVTTQFQAFDHAQRLAEALSRLRPTTMKEHLDRWRWSVHWRAILRALQARGFWPLYYEDHPTELQHILDDELKILQIGITNA